MDLFTYYMLRKKEKRSFTMKEFADEIGCSYSHLSKIIHNPEATGTNLARRLEIATNGQVSLEDLGKEKKASKGNVKKD